MTKHQTANYDKKRISIPKSCSPKREDPTLFGLKLGPWVENRLKTSLKHHQLGEYLDWSRCQVISSKTAGSPDCREPRILEL